MISKSVLKDIQSLGLKKHRDQTGLFVAEGPKVVNELLQVIPEHIQAVYHTDEWKGIAFENSSKVSDRELQYLSQLKTPNQVVAVVKQLESKVPGDTRFTLYLDAIQDPGNFGTIIRIADWFGVNNVVCSNGCADMYNPKVVQSTMGSIARVNVYYDEDENWLMHKTNIYATSLNGKPLSSFSKITNGILIIGNESKGIRKEFRQPAIEQITIPKRGSAESLNAAVATGIILSHLLSE